MKLIALLVAACFLTVACNAAADPIVLARPHVVRVPSVRLVGAPTVVRDTSAASLLIQAAGVRMVK